VLFTGLMRAYKGVDLLVDAWPTVREAFPEATLLVVGKVADSAVASDLDRLEQLPGVIVDRRYVSIAHMLACHAVADVVALPYRRISQSGALMTAAGLGRPAVVTPIPGLVDQARSLRSVTVAAAVSPEAFGRAVVESLRAGPAMRDLALADRERIASSPSGWAAIGRATADAYAGLLPDGGRRPAVSTPAQ
jgi:glycosyltransferase involved in cell wall biosynthesis